MSVIVLRLAGPLQSWGTGAGRFLHRDTAGLPTKSGVIGLLANALGRDRTDDISDLAAARFAVRTEHPGRPVVDYHTASTNPAAPDASGQQTWRSYLHDAEFTAFVEVPDPALAQEITGALARPARQLFLGRRSCPPEGPVLAGTSQEPLEQTLIDWPRPEGAVGDVWARDAAADEDFELHDDQPVTFDHRHRQHTLRRVVRGTLHPTQAATHHDPFRLLEEAECSSPELD